MPKPWDLLSPDVQQRVKSPPLANASPTQVANEIYDVLGQVLSRQQSIRGNVSIGSVIIDGSGVRLFSGGRNTIYLDVDGDAFFGFDLAEASTSSLIILNNDQTYNGEELFEGDILLGDNSSGAANLLWDRSAGILYFRGGTTNRVYIDTTGALTAGGGVVILDNTGIKIDTPTARDDTSTINWYENAAAATTNYARIYAIGTGTGGTFSGDLYLESFAQASGQTSNIHLVAQHSAVSDDAEIVLHSKSDSETYVFLSPYLLMDGQTTEPASPIVNTAQLWADDVSSGNVDFHVRTETGIEGRILNVVTTVARTTTQTITNASNQNIAFTSEIVDDEGWHDNSTNNDRITVLEAGEYSAIAFVAFAANGTGTRNVRIKDSAGNNWGEIREPANASWGNYIVVSGQRTMAASAYVYVEVYQDSGGDLATESTLRFTLVKLR